MSKRTIKLTNRQILELHTAFRVLKAIPIDSRLRYCIARNQSTIDECVKAVNEAIGPEPEPIKQDASGTEISLYSEALKAREDAFQAIVGDVSDVDLHLYRGIPVFDDVRSFPDDALKRSLQNQAIMEALLPMIDADET